MALSHDLFSCLMLLDAVQLCFCVQYLRDFPTSDSASYLPYT